MRKMCRFVSDNTPNDTPNILTMVQRDDGDIEFCISVRHPQESGISIRASGSRLRNYAKVINLFSQIIDLFNEEEKGDAPLNKRQSPLSGYYQPRFDVDEKSGKIICNK